MRAVGPGAARGGRGRALAALLAAASALAAAAPASAESFRFAALGGVHEDLLPEPVPVRVGALTARLSAPESFVNVDRHRVDLEPVAAAAPGSAGEAGSGPAQEGREHRFAVEMRIVGRGKLLVDLTAGGVSQRLEDDVVVPPQSVELAGRVALARGELGYLMTPTELPGSFPVRLESRLIGSLVNACLGFAILAGGLDCDLFEERLTHLDVPMPPPGETYLVPYADLTTEERAALDAYLAG